LMPKLVASIFLSWWVMVCRGRHSHTRTPTHLHTHTHTHTHTNTHTNTRHILFIYTYGLFIFMSNYLGVFYISVNCNTCSLDFWHSHVRYTEIIFH
jgi:hypothetical protein